MPDNPVVLAVSRSMPVSVLLTRNECWRALFSIGVRLCRTLHLDLPRALDAKKSAEQYRSLGPGKDGLSGGFLVSLAVAGGAALLAFIFLSVTG